MTNRRSVIISRPTSAKTRRYRVLFSDHYTHDTYNIISSHYPPASVPARTFMAV